MENPQIEALAEALMARLFVPMEASAAMFM